MDASANFFRLLSSHTLKRFFFFCFFLPRNSRPENKGEKPIFLFAKLSWHIASGRFRVHCLHIQRDRESKRVGETRARTLFFTKTTTKRSRVYTLLKKPLQTLFRFEKPGAFSYFFWQSFSFANL